MLARVALLVINVVIFPLAPPPYLLLLTFR